MTVGLAYNAQLRASKENQVFYSPEWMQENIRSKGLSVKCIGSGETVSRW